MADAGKFKKVRLNTEPTKEALDALNLGDVVYLDGTVYTAREGAYMRALEGGEGLPMDLPKESGANFHCSPAASISDDGSISMGAVTATASFRFSKWIGDWLTLSGAKLILGKGGMTSKDYKQHFVPNGAIYLTTVGYGTGALLGRGITRVKVKKKIKIEKKDKLAKSRKQKLKQKTLNNASRYRPSPPKSRLRESQAQEEATRAEPKQFLHGRQMPKLLQDPNHL